MQCYTPQELIDLLKKGWIIDCDSDHDNDGEGRLQGIELMQRIGLPIGFDYKKRMEAAGGKLIWRYIFLSQDSSEIQMMNDSSPRFGSSQYSAGVFRLIDLLSGGLLLDDMPSEAVLFDELYDELLG